MSDDPSRESGGSAGSHLLQLISRNAPRLIGAAWVVAEAAARRVADVIQAVRAETGPTHHEPEPTLEPSEPEQRAAPAQAEPAPQRTRSEPKPKGQTATHQKKKKSAKHPKPVKRADAKAPAKKPSEKKPKARNRTAKKSKG